ncbi:hypothetical protein [Actinoplanes sp. M2I2]|uniref:hypothetical protein n=1 Tax=Actinoplanes sp. M2I2 TaxID=1734444 RepID=UPI0027E11FDB|nr:hypothetical protein [Actinoplanes sp. M2I2]
MTITASRNGQRVPTPAPQPAAPPNNSGQPVRPAATITTMIVCLPDGLSSDALTAHQLHRHFSVDGTLQARLWTMPKLRPWQRRQMFDLRKGTPAYCAGGPARLLNLTGLRYAAGVGAGIRHQQWRQAVQGTKPAQPWVHFHSRHLNDPSKYSWDTAAADFWRQPRITAMRMHNAVNPLVPLQIGELEMLQAGASAYQHYSALTAICGDALLTEQGHHITPDTDAFSDRATYLEHASHYLAGLADDQRLLAVTL